MPAYKYREQLVFFAAFPHHLSLYGVSRPLLEAFRDDLAGFEVSETTIHFSADHPLPDELRDAARQGADAAERGAGRTR